VGSVAIAADGYEPVPVRLTIWGLVGSCGTLTTSDALSAAAVVGLNLTAIVHDELPPSDAPQVPPATVKSVALTPLIALPIEIVNGDLLVTVVLSVLDDDWDTIPYGSVIGATVSGIVPVTLKLTLWGLPGSGLSTTVKFADSLPSTPGVNVTFIVHDVLAGSVDLQVPPLTMKSAASGPLMLWLSETAMLCLFVTVTVSTTLAPNFVSGIVKLVGVTVTGWAVAVAVGVAVAVAVWVAVAVGVSVAVAVGVAVSVAVAVGVAVAVAVGVGLVVAVGVAVWVTVAVAVAEAVAVAVGVRVGVAVAVGVAVDVAVGVAVAVWVADCVAVGVAVAVGVRLTVAVAVGVVVVVAVGVAVWVGVGVAVGVGVEFMVEGGSIKRDIVYQLVLTEMVDEGVIVEPVEPIGTSNNPSMLLKLPAEIFCRAFIPAGVPRLPLSETLRASGKNTNMSPSAAVKDTPAAELLAPLVGANVLIGELWSSPV
jgi:hypothetical protein